MVTIGGSFALLPFVDKFPYHFRELCICSAAAGIMCLALATKVILIGLSPKLSRAFRKSSTAALHSMIGPGLDGGKSKADGMTNIKPAPPA